MAIKFNRVTLYDNSRAIKEDLEKKTKDALKDAGLFVEGRAKLLSPVDTGHLRGSISHKLESGKEVRIGTKVEYAIYVEKGTSKQKAQPYLTPAVERNINAIKKIFELHLRTVGGR